MQKVICFNHPQYEPEKLPTLHCERCCDIFVENLKIQNRKQEEFSNRLRMGSFLPSIPSIEPKPNSVEWVLTGTDPES